MARAEMVSVDAALRARLDRFRAEHHDDPLGDVATRLLFEDDRVRIWELKLAPGEASDLHRHELDYVLVVLEGDCIAALPQGPERDPYVARIPPEGTTVAMRRGRTEWAVNVGERTYREIVIELKGGATP